ncbi:glycoside hydrolase [Umezawaea sp. Da 62-37]|uniref:glycoside hydrolase n=1 Tax=Umezawaea sp. Da 62-37 TaxID=3075927 RepID=UPI0028F74A6D|nr:glycoside hydrolase [Umezawaea sp. Da 62-37]WNV88452.1 glycoside hydrolase [Umezawaea sp. Da 62-37]
MAQARWAYGLATLLPLPLPLPLPLVLALAVVLVVVLPVPVPAAVAQVSSSPAQTRDNSGAWWVNDLARFSQAIRQRMADLLFGADGLRRSAYRYNSGGGGAAGVGGGGGVGVAAGNRAPQTPPTSLGTYDWSRDPGGTEFLRQATSYGVPDLVGFANSAPAVWKDNAKSCDGHLKAGCKSAFAGYPADVVTHFHAEDVRINHLSPMNEPQNSFNESPCSPGRVLVEPAQRDDIVRAVGAHGLGVGISADESSTVLRSTSKMPQWTNQAGTDQYVTTLVHHTYDFPSDATLAGVAGVRRQFDKPTRGSEIRCSTGSTAATPPPMTRPSGSTRSASTAGSSGRDRSGTR